MVFFPSYQYMEDVSERFIEGVDAQSIMVMRQERGLSEKDKEAFFCKHFMKNENIPW